MYERHLDISDQETGEIIYRNLERHGIATPFRLLDVGTGKGEVVEQLRGLGVEAYGVDLRQVFPEGKDYYQVADASAIPFPDSHFKVVTESLMVAQMYELDHRKEEDIVKVFREMGRVLEPGGLFVSNWGFRNLVRPNWGRRVLKSHMSELGFDDLNQPTERHLFIFRKPATA